MTPDDYAAFIETTCQQAKAAGVGLSLMKCDKTDDGHTWHWSNGIKGHTTAATREVALYHACCDYVDSENIKRGFNNVVFTKQ